MKLYKSYRRGHTSTTTSSPTATIVTDFLQKGVENTIRLELVGDFDNNNNNNNNNSKQIKRIRIQFK